MLNQSGIAKQDLVSREQILANVEHQVSIGCIVSDALGVTVDNRKIVKAGTPISLNLLDTQVPAVLATSVIVADAETGAAMSGVLLHDVDVTNGNANGTALIFGFVNLNRITDTSVQALITTAVKNAGASKLVTFLKV
ncbi:MAG: hypothetical protein FWE95_08525 [Planctomycetaceae bacterium]|nr:hypothetical protein [Planctomycetaceae bacterium]